MWPKVGNTLAYYYSVLITALKYFHSAGSVLTKLFLRNLQMGQIARVVTQLQIKYSFVDLDPGASLVSSSSRKCKIWKISVTKTKGLYTQHFILYVTYEFAR